MNTRLHRILIVGVIAAVTIATIWFKLVRPGNYFADGWIIIPISLLVALKGAVRALASSDLQLNSPFRGEQFHEDFRLWFCIACAFFVFANMMGCGTGKLHSYGMPLEFYPTFDHDILAIAAFFLDTAFALGYSCLCGFGMACSRARRRRVSQTHKTATKCPTGQ